MSINLSTEALEARLKTLKAQRKKIKGFCFIDAEIQSLSAELKRRKAQDKSLAAAFKKGK